MEIRGWMLMKKLILLGIVLMFAIPLASASTVTRVIANDSVYYSDIVQVTLNVNIDNGASFYIIDEVLPSSGWTIINSGTGDTSTPGHLKWVVISGASSTSYTYTVRAPSVSGVHQFSGEYIFEFMANTAPIAGETQVSVSAPPIPVTVSNVRTSGVGNSSAAVLWDTNVASNSTVYFGTTPSLGQVNSINNAVTSHSIILSNLEQSTQYYYKAESCDQYSCANSSVYSFTTSATMDQTDDLNVNYVRGQIYIDSVLASPGTNYTIRIIGGQNNSSLYYGQVDSNVPQFLVGSGFFDSGDQVTFSTDSTFRVEVEDCDPSDYVTGTFQNGGNGNFATGQGLVTVYCNNSPPEMNELADYNLLEGQSVSNPLSDLWNETSDVEDADANLTFEITGQTNTNLVNCAIASNKYVNCNLAGIETYGTSSVTVRVTDTGGLTDSSTFDFIVTHVNLPPTIGVNDTIIAEDSFTTLNLDNYANDPNNDTLTYSIMFEDVNKVNCDIAGSTLTVAGATNFNGISICSVRAFDGVDYSAVDNFSITVTAVNDAPTFNSSNPIPSQTWPEDTSTIINLNNYFNDIDGGTLSYSSFGTSQINIVINNGIATLTPALNWNGAESVVFIATDSGNASVSSNLVSLTVTPVNDAPVLGIADQSMLEDSVLNFDLGIYTSDVENDSVTYFVSNENTVDCSVNGSILSVIPPADYFGTGSCGVIANDGIANSSISSFSVNVSNVQDAPTFNASNPISNQTWEEDTGAIISVNLSQYFSDPDNEPTIFSGSPTQNAIVNIAGDIAYFTSPSNWFGTDYVVFYATDAQNETASSNNVTLTITPVNDAPFFTSTPVTTAIEDSLYTYDANAFDVENDTLAYSLITAPPGMVIDNASGLISWTPLNEHVGIAIMMSVQVSDGSLVELQDFQIDVNNTNDAPTFNASNPIPDMTWNEDANASIDLGPYFSDMDLGDSLTYGSSGTTNVQVVIMGSTATLVPAADWNGVENVVFTATDSSNDSVSSNLVMLTVTPVNDAPVITSLPITAATEDLLYTYDVAASDLENDVLTFSLIQSLAGMVINSSTGIIEWTPVNEQVGLNSVNVSVSDGSLTANQYFTVNVTNTNDAPTFNASNPIPDVAWAEDTNATIDLNDYFSDMDMGDMLVYSINGNNNINVIFNNGIAKLIPAANWNGAESVVFSATDNGNESVSSNTVLLTVTPVNDAPVIVSTPITAATEDSLYTYDVDATDLENDTLTYSLLSSPAGMIINIISGVIIWTPLNENVGPNAVSVQASDGSLTAIQNFTIYVNNTNDAPTFNASNPIPDQTWNEDTNAAINLNNYFNDMDLGDALTYSVSGNVNINIVFNNGIATLAPVSNWNGVENVVFTAIDGSGSNVSGNSVQLTVAPVNDAPVLDFIADITTVENLTVDINPTASDVDNDTLTFSFSAPLDSNGVWVPDFNESGIYTVTISVSDGTLSDSQNVQIIVGESGNHDPIIQPISDVTITEGDLVDIDPVASDIDYDPLTFTFSAPLDNNGRWQTNYTNAGIYSASATVNDGNGGNDTAQFTITVLESGNHAPVLVPVSDVTVTEGQFVDANVDASDPDGDPLTITYTFPLDSNGEWQTGYTDAGIYVSFINVSDGQLSVSDDMVITVQEAGNQNPVLNSIPNIVVMEGDLADINPTATDPENDPLTFSFSTPLDSNGEWQTDYTDAGIYPVSVVVIDSYGATDSQILTITVLESGNHDPVLNPIANITVTEGETAIIQPSGSDSDGDSLTFSYTSPFNSQGRWSTDYTDAGGYMTIVSVTDGKGGFDSQEVFVTVLESGNHAPTLEVDDIDGFAGDLIEVNPAVSDPDGDSVTVTISEPVGNDGVWQTADGDEGQYTVIVTASDGQLQVSRTITITLEEKKLNRLHISRIKFSSEIVRPGEPLDVYVTVENDGSITEKDLRVSLLMPDIGEWAKSRSFDLKPGREATQKVTVEIPPDIEQGEYDVRVVISNDRNRRVKVRPVVIE